MALRPKKQEKSSKNRKATSSLSYDTIPRDKPAFLDNPPACLLWPDDVSEPRRLKR
ncbi:MAG TPA: hypothetical protein VFE51_11155 [Verrucomicrobiae bacterium]|nr:hypothetical protein [Verrucomicrobiae bacterium]